MASFIPVAYVCLLLSVREYSFWLISGLVAALYIWVIVSSRSRHAKTEAFRLRIEASSEEAKRKSQADSEEYMRKAQIDFEVYTRHMAAVEQKLDRIIALMEQSEHRDP